MSYLNLPNGIPKFSKAVISFWFRVPAEKIREVTEDHQRWQNREVPFHRFMGVIPLMTWGPTGLKSRKFYFPSRTVGPDTTFETWVWTDGPGGHPACVGAGWGIDHSSTSANTANYWSFEQNGGGFAGGDRELDGSYIGVDCTGDKPSLGVSIVMPVDNTATFKGNWPVLESRSGGVVKSYRKNGGFCPGAPEFYDHGSLGLCFTEILESRTHTEHHVGNADVILGHIPETFRTLPAGITSQGVDNISENLTQLEIEPDQWHHVLLSFDLSNGVETIGNFYSIVRNANVDSGGPPPGMDTSLHPGTRTTRACRMWIALDNVNKTNEALSCYWPEPYADPNAILSVNGYWVARDSVYQITETNNPRMICDGVNLTFIMTVDSPSYEFTPEEIDMSALGIPAHSAHVDYIKQVEMAELQLFTGVTLDTGIESNRRAFLDYKRDKDGNPVSDKDGKLKLEPVKPAVAEVLLGKRPELLLHKTSKWQKGENTGSIGKNPDGTLIPAGQFTRTGVIDKYKPDPSIVPAAP